MESVRKFHFLTFGLTKWRAEVDWECGWGKMAETTSTTLQDSLEGDDEDEYIVPKKKFRPVASGEGE